MSGKDAYAPIADVSKPAAYRSGVPIASWSILTHHTKLVGSYYAVGMPSSVGHSAKAVVQRRRLVTGAVILIVAGRAGSYIEAFGAERPRVAVINITDLVPGSKEALLQGFGDVGLRPERDFDLDYRPTGSEPAGIAHVVREVVASAPVVIISGTTGITVQLKRATNSIPIVSNVLTDPIGLGMIASFAHPGGNVTGMNAQASTPGKQLELLQEVSNGGARLGILFNPNNEGNVVGLEQLRKAADALSIALVPVPATTGNEIEPAFAQFAREKVAGVLVGQDGVLTALPVLAEVTSLAIAVRLPTISGFRNFADAGGLMSYGSSPTALWRHSGFYAARIIKGEAPGDLPFEQPPKLEMVINLKTAKAIGLDIPRSVIARADDLIE